mmetsp:Transcript_447/g.1263  ORF Transcript_447/g.1263 Transcript_447/m.1263 type:complete len:215 (+) Transcript_447:428-1072(+)
MTKPSSSSIAGPRSSSSTFAGVRRNLSFLNEGSARGEASDAPAEEVPSFRGVSKYAPPPSLLSFSSCLRKNSPALTQELLLRWLFVSKPVLLSTFSWWLKVSTPSHLSSRDSLGLFVLAIARRILTQCSLPPSFQAQTFLFATLTSGARHDCLPFEDAANANAPLRPHLSLSQSLPLATNHHTHAIEWPFHGRFSLSPPVKRRLVRKISRYSFA